MQNQIDEYIKVEGEKLASKVLDSLKESTRLYTEYYIPGGTESKIIQEAELLLNRAGWKCKTDACSINIWIEETE